ncbi:MAG: redoxin family protein, partial [Amylibacter sp.]|nr:redoxin family protein [Amylibacter sp.]
MKISVGDTLPNATFQSMGDDGPVAHDIKDLTAGKKIVIFGLPGAYTNTCSTAHMPSFVRNAETIRANGVDAIYCLAVNDVHVMKSWAKDMGADVAQIGM